MLAARGPGRALLLFRLHPQLAAMAVAILFPKGFRLRLRAEDFRRLPALHDDLISLREDLEGLSDFAEMIEADRPGLAEAFEVGRIDEIRHGDAVHLEAQGFHGVGAFVGVDE